MAGHIDKAEGRTLFGADPDNYNAIRPPYPEQIEQFLLSTGALYVNAATLEIGAGNGLATRRLLALGAQPLTVIEPDRRFAPLLAAIATLHKTAIRCIHTSFEEAELPLRHYDLVAAATAFHWLEPASSLAKIAAILKPGGAVALWWHVFGDTKRQDAYHEATQTILQPLASSPSDQPDAVPFALDVPARLQDFARSGQFEPPAYIAYRWTWVLNTAQVGDLYATFSSISRLPERQRQTILQQLMDVAERQFGGRVERNMVAPIYVARRKPMAM